MAELAASTKAKKPAQDSSSVSSSGVSDIDDAVNGSVQPPSKSDRKSSKKKRKQRSKDGGIDEWYPEDGGRSLSKRRNSVLKAARDPRDEPEGKKRKKVKVEGTVTRSPSPVIDFDGLSRPSKTPRKRNQAGAC